MVSEKDRPAVPPTPASTGPLAGWRPPFVPVEGVDIVTALAEFNRNGEFPLPTEREVTKIGASRRCEIHIHSRGLSAIHAELHRHERMFTVVDADSTHGVLYRKHRVPRATIGPGDTFWLPPMHFVALNEPMRQHRPTFLRIIGTATEHQSPDKVMLAAYLETRNLLVQCEDGCDQVELARAIHAVAPRQRPCEPIVVTPADVPAGRAEQRAMIDRASHSTVILSLGAKPLPIDPTWVELLFDRAFHIRTVVLAPTQDAAEDALNRDDVGKMQRTWIWPLGYRTEEIHTLMDGELERLGSPVRCEHLSPENRDALQRHSWRRNFDELRQVARAIAVYYAQGGQRPAAKALGITRNNLHKMFERVGLSFPKA